MRLVPILAACLAFAGPATAQVPCGGDFSAFVTDLKREAVRRGHDRTTVARFFDSVRRDPAVIRADRAQGIFQSGFLAFSQKLISRSRLQAGARNARDHAAMFDAIERRLGVSRGILLAFWALETDYGAVQGDTNTANALVTLAHDCRRPGLFRPQVFGALELFAQGDFDPATTTGAWAGEIGMIQVLPSEIVAHGVDADGDGEVALKTSVPDALFTGAAILRKLGWRPNAPWLREVRVPDAFDWSRTGLEGRAPVTTWQRLGVRGRGRPLAPAEDVSLILPQGRGGPAFLAYPNFRVLFEWNESFVYVTTAAYLATRLEGAPVYDAGDPAPALSEAEMKALQRRLRARGHDVGGVDGILGANTRAAVQAEQERLGLPADAWPTRALLDRL